MLFTRRESRRTSDSALLRVRSKELRLHPQAPWLWSPPAFATLGFIWGRIRKKKPSADARVCSRSIRTRLNPICYWVWFMKSKSGMVSPKHITGPPLRSLPGLPPPPIIWRFTRQIRTKKSTKHFAWPPWPKKNCRTVPRSWTRSAGFTIKRACTVRPSLSFQTAWPGFLKLRRWFIISAWHIVKTAMHRKPGSSWKKPWGGWEF